MFASLLKVFGKDKTQQQSDKSKSNGEIDQEGESRDGNDPVTLEEAWLDGQSILNTFQESGLANLALQAALPGILSLAKEFPFVGPVAGVLLQCYQVIQDMQGNRDAFADLKDKVELAAKTLIQAKQVLQQLQMMKSSSQADEDPLKIHLQNLCKATMEATKLMQAIDHRISSRHVKDIAASLALTQLDQDRISANAAAIDTAILGFNTGVVASFALSSISKEQTNKLSALFEGFVTYDSVIAELAAKFRPGSRQWLHDEIDHWLQHTKHTSKTKGNTSSDKKLFWLRAGAGMGKSVFTASLVQRLQTQGQLLGAVFFRFNDERASNPAAVLRSLAKQIAMQIGSETQDKIFAAAEALKNDVNKDNIDTVFSKLILEPLSTLSSEATDATKTESINRSTSNDSTNSRTKSMVIVFDALDEIAAEGSAVRKDMLKLLKNSLAKLPNWVKVYATGRPETDIVEALDRFSHTIDEQDPRHLADLRDYIEYSLSELGIAEHNHSSSNSDCEENALNMMTDLLMQKSEGQFIYTAVVTDEIGEWYKDFIDDNEGRDEDDDDEYDHKKVLERAVSTIRTNSNTTHAFGFDEFKAKLEQLPNGIDGCYKKTFEKLPKGNKLQKLVKDFSLLMVSALEPLSDLQMRFMLGLTTKKDDNTFAMLVAKVSTIFPMRESVVPAPSDQHSASPRTAAVMTEKKFYPIHKSIIDWLILGEHAWQCDPTEGHLLIAKKLLKQVDFTLPDKPILDAEDDNSNEEGVTKLMQQVDSITWRHWLGLSSDTAASLLLTSKHGSPYLGDKISPLKLYCLRHVLDHLDKCDELYGYQYLSYILLMNLSFIQAVLESVGLSVLRGEYRKRWKDDSWLAIYLLPSSPQSSSTIVSPHGFSFRRVKKDMKLMMQFCVLLLPVKKDRQCAWVTEVCTQVTGRLRAAAKTSLLFAKLLSASEAFIRSHGGWLLRNNGLTTPGGEVEMQISFTAQVMCLLIHPVLEYLAIIGFGNGHIHFGNIDDGSRERILIGHQGDVTALCILRDGRLASGSEDKTIRIWMVEDGTCEKVIQGEYEEKVESLCILQDGSLVSASWHKIYIWNVDDGTCQKVLDAKDEFICTLLTLEDGRLVSGSTKSIRIWNVQDGTYEQLLEANITSLCLMLDGCLANGSNDGSIQIWNVDYGTCTKVLQEEIGDKVTSLYALQDGRLASGTQEGIIHIWNVDLGSCDRILTGHEGYVSSLCTLQDGTLASGSYDETIRIWNVEESSFKNTIEGHEKNVTSLCMLDDGRLATSSWDETIRIWNINDGCCMKVIKGHDKEVFSLCLLQDGRLVSGSDDIRIWNTHGTCEKIIESKYGFVTSLCLLSNGSRVASGALEENIRIFNVDTGTIEQTLVGHEKNITALCLLQDGRLASGSEDMTIRIWNIQQDGGRCERILTGHEGLLYSLCLLQDGRLVSGSMDGMIRIWNVEEDGSHIIQESSRMSLSSLLMLLCRNSCIEGAPLQSTFLGMNPSSYRSSIRCIRAAVSDSVFGFCFDNAVIIAEWFKCK